MDLSDSSHEKVLYTKALFVLLARRAALSLMQLILQCSGATMVIQPSLATEGKTTESRPPIALINLVLGTQKNTRLSQQ